VALMSWVLVALLVGTLIDPRPVIAQYLLTLALFPGLTWVLVRAQRAFLKQA
jgi:rod shape-determining protein MreD